MGWKDGDNQAVKQPAAAHLVKLQPFVCQKLQEIGECRFFIGEEQIGQRRLLVQEAAQKGKELAPIQADSEKPYWKAVEAMLMPPMAKK